MLFSRVRSERNARSAAQFVARLYSGDMTAADEQALERWLAADPARRAEYQAAISLYEAGAALAGDPSLAPLSARDSSVREVQPRTPGWRWAAVAASLVAVIGAIVTVGILRSPEMEFARYETAVGERRDVVLADGTRLTLNTNTRVVVDYSADRRRLILDYGEIFLDVVRNRARPLTVQLGSRAITVLGTQFNVYRNAEDFSVAVVEGRVAVHPSNRAFVFEAQARVANAAARSVRAPATPADAAAKPDDAVVLDAGAMATFTGGAVESRRLAQEEITETWRSGVVRFEAEPLYRVIRELNRYSTKKVLIEDLAVMELPISGVFRPAQIEAVLASLEHALPVQVVDYPDRYVIVSRTAGAQDAPSMNAAVQKETANQKSAEEGR